MLNLPSMIETKTKEHGEHDYHIYARPCGEIQPCPICSSVKYYRHGKNKQLIMDTPIHGRRVGILLERQRYQCRDCKKTFYHCCDDVNDNHRATNRLVKYIEERAMVRPCTAVADDVGITEGTIRNILRAHIEELESTYTFETPMVLGIDEAHLNKKMRLVMTNIKERTIIDLVEDRTKKTVIRVLNALKDKENIKIVTMDMWAPYRDAVKTVLPEAIIVIDKFHIVKMANEAVDKGRKSLKDEMEQKLVTKLKKDRFLMLKRRRDLSPMQEMLLSGWTMNYPTLYQLYNAKEDFFDIWDSKVPRKDAEKAYEQWKMNIPSDMMHFFSDLVRAVDNWSIQVFNYFDHRYTNAFTESANNQIKHIYKMGRGYNFDVLRARVLFVPENHKRKVSFKSGVDIDHITCFSLSDKQEGINYGTKILHNDIKTHVTDILNG